MSVSLKSLIGKLNDTCRSALEAAAGLCLTRTHYDVDIEHLFLKLSEVPNSDMQRLLRHYEIDQARLARDLTRALDRLKTGNARTPALSPRIPRLIAEAWSLASIDFNAPGFAPDICSWQLLENDDLARLARESAQVLQQIAVPELHQHLADLVAGSGEDRPVAATSAAETLGPAGSWDLQDASAGSVYARLDRQGPAGGHRSGAGTGLRDPAVG